ncbi:MAG: PIG-L family deacetylase [Thermomicrobiales bacterium]
MSGPLLLIFAHPDDETFSSAGLMRAAIERGIKVTVISATRGEAGESSIPGLDDPERLGAVRETELRDAMHELGVDDVRFLDYHDSGLAASSQPDPLALTEIPVGVVAARLAELIRSLQPQTIVTFGSDGIYGHPDHIHIHDAASLAVHLAADAAWHGTDAHPWATPSVYFATAPREELQAMAAADDGPLSWISPEWRSHLGTPTAQITHILDLSPWAPFKEAAIRAHRTQIAPGGPLSSMPEEARERWLSREHYVQAPLSAAPGGTSDLLESLVAK